MIYELAHFIGQSDHSYFVQATEKSKEKLDKDKELVHFKALKEFCNTIGIGQFQADFSTLTHKKKKQKLYFGTL
jgi:hypothetical protein